MKASRSISKVLAVVLLAGVSPLLVVLAADACFGHAPHVQESLHEWFELAGGGVALAVAMLLWLRLRHETTPPHLLWVVTALVAMSIVDGLHGVHGISLQSWQRHGATLLGGVLFGLVWLPLPAAVARWKGRFIFLVAGLALALGLWWGSAWMPVTWDPVGLYTLPVKAVNTLGGLGFLAAAAFFLRRHLSQSQTEDLVFASHTLLFSASSLFFGYSHTWAVDWWVWHGVRLLAFTVLLIAAYAVVVTLYQQIARQAQTLEHRVEARTAELLRANHALREEIGNHQQAEAALHQSEEFNRRIVESSHDCIKVLDLDANLLSMSAGGQRLLGIANLGPYFNHGWVESWQDADRPRVREAVADARAGNVGRFQGFCPAATGEPRWWDVIVTAIRSPAGQPRQLLAISRDITERKRAEAELERKNEEQARLNEELTRANRATLNLMLDALAAKDRLEKANRDLLREISQRQQAENEIQKLNTELEQRVTERTAQLEAANQELEAFSYSVSHDLRAPLRAIDGFSRILTEDYAPRLDGEGQRLLGVVSREANRMGQLIDDLLAFARLNRQPVQVLQIDLGALAQAAFDEFAAQAPGRKLEFNLHPLPPAQGDAAMIRVVLGNLLSNAIKFSKPRNPAVIEIGVVGGDRSHLTRDQKAEALPHYLAPLTYFVRDNGVGFDMKYASSLFGVFQRLHTEDEFEGTGVGLALVQRIIHRHGGRVWAEGEVNAGATFYFTLPNSKGES